MQNAHHLHNMRQKPRIWWRKLTSICAILINSSSKSRAAILPLWRLCAWNRIEHQNGRSLAAIASRQPSSSERGNVAIGDDQYWQELLITLKELESPATSMWRLQFSSASTRASKERQAALWATRPSEFPGSNGGQIQLKSLGLRLQSQRRLIEKWIRPTRVTEN